MKPQDYRSKVDSESWQYPHRSGFVRKLWGSNWKLLKMSCSHLFYKSEPIKKQTINYFTSDPHPDHFFVIVSDTAETKLQKPATAGRSPFWWSPGTQATLAKSCVAKSERSVLISSNRHRSPDETRALHLVMMDIWWWFDGWINMITQKKMTNIWLITHDSYMMIMGLTWWVYPCTLIFMVTDGWWWLHTVELSAITAGW